MKKILIAALGATFCVAAPAFADHDRGRHYGHHKSHTQVFYDGHCRVEREYKHNGKVKEKRECYAPRHVYHPVYHEPVVVHQPPVIVRPQPSVVVHLPPIVFR